MTNRPMPEGPIYIDFTDMFMDMPVRKLVRLANLAMNDMTSRQIGALMFDLGVDVKFAVVPLDDGEADHPASCVT